MAPTPSLTLALVLSALSFSPLSLSLYHTLHHVLLHHGVCSLCVARRAHRRRLCAAPPPSASARHPPLRSAHPLSRSCSTRRVSFPPLPLSITRSALSSSVAASAVCAWRVAAPPTAPLRRTPPVGVRAPTAPTRRSPPIALSLSLSPPRLVCPSFSDSLAPHCPLSATVSVAGAWRAAPTTGACAPCHRRPFACAAHPCAALTFSLALALPVSFPTLNLSLTRSALFVLLHPGVCSGCVACRARRRRKCAEPPPPVSARRPPLRGAHILSRSRSRSRSPRPDSFLPLYPSLSPPPPPPPAPSTRPIPAQWECCWCADQGSTYCCAPTSPTHFGITSGWTYKGHGDQTDHYSYCS